jgi:hypothetical protein
VRTIIRDLYGALVVGETLHRPSSPHVPVALYAVAVPAKKYSRSEYPYCFSNSVGIAFTGTSGVPPDIGPVTVGTATGETGGTRADVVGVELVVTVVGVDR